ncbi:MAG: SBBP repeat-containing protein [Promethearchaeota archaeon]
MKKQIILSLILSIIFFNFSIFTIECWSLPEGTFEEELGTYDWYSIWPYSDMHRCYDMVLDSYNNIYLTGTIFPYTSGSSCDMVLVKYHNDRASQSSVVWDSKGDDFSYALALDSSENIYLAGISGYYSKNNYTLVKFDKDLDFQWNRTWGLFEDNDCKDIAIDSNDNIYLAGNIKQKDRPTDICVVKYNKLGQFQWFKTWGFSFNDYCNAIAIDSSDNIYLAGAIYKSNYYDTTDLCLLKYNSSGDLQWSKVWGNSMDFLSLGIELDSKENIFVMGEAHAHSTARTDAYIVKFNNTGDFQWNITFSGIYSTYCSDIAVDTFDNIYIAGLYMRPKSSGESACVIKYDNNGNLQWYEVWGEPHITYCRAISLDNMENILIAGDISAYEYEIEGMFVVQNPKTKDRTKSISSFPIIQIIFFISIGSLILMLNKIKIKKKETN